MMRNVAIESGAASGLAVRGTKRASVWLLLVVCALLGATIPGCGGGSSSSSGGGGGGSSTAGGERTTPGGTSGVTERDRQRWGEAMRNYETAAADGFTPQECQSLISTFERVNNEHQGDFVEAIYMVAVVQEKCGNSEAAQQQYARVLQINPRFCGARVALGVSHYEAGRVQQARGEFEQAVRDDARCTEGYVNLAILQRREVATSGEALNNLRRALAIKSSYLPAFNQMALLYLEQAQRQARTTSTVQGGTAQVSGTSAGQPQEASNDSTRAARQAAARRAAAAQMLSLAEVVCRQAQLIDGNYAPIYNTWGLINVQQGNIVAALAKFERAAVLKPDFFEAYMNFGELTLSFRGYEDAQTAFVRATELRPNSYDAWLGLGAARRGLNRAEEAQAAYEHAIQLDGSRPEAYFNLGLLYNDYMDGAEPTLRRAQQYYRDFAQRASGRQELAPIVESVNRTCGCEHRQQGESARRLAARRRAGGGHYRRARSCESGRIEQIDCNIELTHELQQMQAEMAEMQRQIEAQAAAQEAAAQPEAGAGGDTAPAAGAEGSETPTE